MLSFKVYFLLALNGKTLFEDISNQQEKKQLSHVPRNQYNPLSSLIQKTTYQLVCVDQQNQ